MLLRLDQHFVAVLAVHDATDAVEQWLANQQFIESKKTYRTLVRGPKETDTIQLWLANVVGGWMGQLQSGGIGANSFIELGFGQSHHVFSLATFVFNAYNHVDIDHRCMRQHLARESEAAKSIRVCFSLYTYSLHLLVRYSRLHYRVSQMGNRDKRVQ